MKESSIIRLAFFYLALLVSHEGITVASNIRQTIGLQKGAELSSSLTNMVKMMENVDVDSFLEVEDMHGMSAEAYGTMEMIEMHKSLKEGFSFEHSPILQDLKSLKEIPENKVLSPSELKQHREDVSVLLEKAMSSSSMGIFGKAMEGLEQGSRRPKRSTKTSSSLGSIAKQKLKNLDTGKALAHTKEIDKTLTVKGAIGAALFGFVDGFFSGMASEFRDAFESKTCHGGNVHKKLKHVIHKLKHMWSHMKKVHEKVWTSEGRKAIIHAVIAFIVSLVELLKEGLKYMWQCPATKMLVVMVGMIAVMLIMNIAFMAISLVVIPLIVKYVGMIMGLYFSFEYMKDKVVSLYQGTKKMIAEKCHGTCKKKMIEDSFGMAGAITEIIVLSGLDKVLKIKVDKAKPFFKRFGMEMHPVFKQDMIVLGNAVKRCKVGLGFKKLKLKSKISYVMDWKNSKFSISDTETGKFVKTSLFGENGVFKNLDPKLKTLEVQKAFEKSLMAHNEFRVKFMLNHGKDYATNPTLRSMYTKRAVEVLETAFKHHGRKIENVDELAKKFFKWDGLGKAGLNDWSQEYVAYFHVKFNRNSNILKYNNVFGHHADSVMAAKKAMTSVANVALCILPGTKHTLDDTKDPICKSLMGKSFSNFVRPKSNDDWEKLNKSIQRVVDSKRNANKRRRLLGWADDWEYFTHLVEDSDERSKNCNKDVLKRIIVDDSGEFYFECSKAKALCRCIEHIGSRHDEQKFEVDNIELNVFYLPDDRTVSYEIKVDREPIAYGDVNEGDVERALNSRGRRRLLQAGSSGGS